MRDPIYLAALLMFFGVGATLASSRYASAASSAAAKSTGGVNLHQIDRSGIRGRIEFVDRGNAADGLEVTGTATGLDPDVSYISLVYDAGAKPSGPRACAPSSPGDLTGLQMFVSGWQVDADGNGTLHVLKTGPFYVALDAIGAMSIREEDTRALQACGKVTPADEATRTCAIETPQRGVAR